MALEENGSTTEALNVFEQAWKEASNDFEKYLAAYFVARQQKEPSDKLKWLETAIQFALKVNDDGVKSAFPGIYADIAKCYENLGESGKAEEHNKLTASFKDKPADKGPFYHGTRADLPVGDFLTPGGQSNYKADLKMNHIYFTALSNNAGLAAALAKGDGQQRVYIIEPTGNFENDPNVTDKKFPGNPTRSYRSSSPLKIVGEVTDWVRITPEELKVWQNKLDKNKGEIIN
ncbi:MAG: NAD(+)--rifampin ADP-ribosyltransferase [Saprospiraceae bacterium]|nr:NAD(+)--rifampin ADP-ribosyltransferase [Saprospiraceae bacterium]